LGAYRQVEWEKRDHADEGAECICSNAGKTALDMGSGKRNELRWKEEGIRSNKRIREMLKPSKPKDRDARKGSILLFDRRCRRGVGPTMFQKKKSSHLNWKIADRGVKKRVRAGGSSGGSQGLVGVRAGT